MHFNGLVNQFCVLLQSTISTLKTTCLTSHFNFKALGIINLRHKLMVGTKDKETTLLTFEDTSYVRSRTLLFNLHMVQTTISQLQPSLPCQSHSVFS